ncbi:hypothetical protein JCM31271_07550 [Halorubrum trueperi]
MDDALADAVESALTGRSDVVAVGVPLGLLPPILAAREGSGGGAWRVACCPGVVDSLGRAFVLGTAVAEAVADGAIELRRVSDGARNGDGATAARILFATQNRVDAIAGPAGARTVVTETDPGRVRPAGRAVTERFDAASRASVDMPSRTRLLAAARERLDDRFATDVAAVLDSLEYGTVGRGGTVTDQTLLVALAARHDHLFRDVRAWIGTEEQRGGGHENGVGPGCGGAVGSGDEGTVGSGDGGAVESGGGAAVGGGVGIAPGQELTADRRALVERELIESIKVPMGPGRPKLRLRAIDDALLRARPEVVLRVLRGRFDLPLSDDGTVQRGQENGDRRPVWERMRRR